MDGTGTSLGRNLMYSVQGVTTPRAFGAEASARWITRKRQTFLLVDCETRISTLSHDAHGRVGVLSVARHLSPDSLQELAKVTIDLGVNFDGFP